MTRALLLLTVYTDTLDSAYNGVWRMASPKAEPGYSATFSWSKAVPDGRGVA